MKKTFKKTEVLNTKCYYSKRIDENVAQKKTATAIAPKGSIWIGLGLFQSWSNIFIFNNKSHLRVSAIYHWKQSIYTTLNLELYDFSTWTQVGPHTASWQLLCFSVFISVHSKKKAMPGTKIKSTNISLGSADNQWSIIVVCVVCFLACVGVTVVQ